MSTIPSTSPQDYSSKVGSDFRGKTPWKSGRSTFKLKDINYTSTKKSKGVGIFGEARTRPVDIMLIEEFQPDLRFNWVEVAANILNTAGQGLETAAGNAVGGLVTKVLTKTGSKGAKGRTAEEAAKIVEGGADLAKKVANTGFDIAAKKSSENHMAKLLDEVSKGGAGGDASFIQKILTDPVDQVKSMLGGGTAANFEIPYTGDVFLTNQQSNFWKGAADFKSALANNSDSAALTILKDSTAINFPATPTWNAEEGGGAPEPVSVELILYNNNLDNLIKNYRYIHCLVQGSYWSQIGYFQKSSNLYHITLPARLKYYFCTLEHQVQYLGKKRRLPENMANYFNSKFSGGAVPQRSEIGNSGMFPDAYKLSLTFKSLMPNSFNMYLHYFTLLKEAEGAGAITNQEFKSGLTDTFAALAAAGGEQGLAAIQTGVSAAGRVFGVQ